MRGVEVGGFQGCFFDEQSTTEVALQGLARTAWGDTRQKVLIHAIAIVWTPHDLSSGYSRNGSKTFDQGFSPARACLVSLQSRPHPRARRNDGLACIIALVKSQAGAMPRQASTILFRFRRSLI
jgi:hypothetical protein